MPKIYVNITGIRNTNQELRFVEQKVNAAGRGVGRLQRQIPEEIGRKYQIRDRLYSICREIDRLEDQIEELYRITNSCADQYAYTELENNRNAEAFY